MLPTDPWPAWILFAAALVQTVAAVIQVTQGRRPRGAARAGTGVSTGVRFGLAALVLEFGGWLAAREFSGGPQWLRLAVFTLALLFGALAFFFCLKDLLATPGKPAPPRIPNPPVDTTKIDVWHAVMRAQKAQHEQDLEGSRQSPVRVFSSVLGAAGGLAVVYTALILAGVLS